MESRQQQGACRLGAPMMPQQKTSDDVQRPGETAIPRRVIQTLGVPVPADYCYCVKEQAKEEKQGPQYPLDNF